MISPSQFASLHNHTAQGSLLDSITKVDELIQQAKDLGFKAVAISEHGNLHTVVNGYKKAKELGIKFIPACEVYETEDMDYKEADAKRYHLLLLAKNNTGYVNLNKIVSEGSTRGFYGKMRVDMDLLRKYSEGIIATSACLASRIMRKLTLGYCPCCRKGNGEHKETCDYDEVFEPKWDEAIELVNQYKEIFGDDFYLEIQSHDTVDQTEGNQRIIELAKMTNTKTVLTFDSHMLSGDELERDIHRKFVQVSQNSREVGETYKDCYQQDMDTLYGIMTKQISVEDLEEALINTGLIADQCNVEIELHQNLMPEIELPKEFKTQKEYFLHLIKEGYKKRGINKKEKSVQDVYKKRIKNEIEVLDYLDYIPYLNINAVLIQKFKDANIPLGESRGSGANCLCLYLLGVTNVDSVRWDLDFSRFANRGRKGSLADYDIDISKAKRHLALQIIREMFGDEYSAHIATFNSMSPKVAIKDLGKVFDEQKIYSIDYKEREKIAKLIPDKFTIEQALENSDELKEYENRYPLLFQYAKRIQNLPKSVGCHASAIAISKVPLTDITSIMLNKDGGRMIHLEMHNAQDDIGLLKLDLLGLETLDVIDLAQELAGLDKEKFSTDELDFNDEKTLELLRTGDTLGIFQMESYVAQKLIKDIQPDSIHDLIAVNAMNRPAILSIGMDKLYIKNKRKPNEIVYLHDDLKPILEKTYNVALYQEQALKILGLAGFDESEQDDGRRAIGKKLQNVMVSLREKFENGLKKRNWSDEQIDKIWNIIVAQAEYSFNLGHKQNCATVQ